jgi:hypothetical protein
MQSNVTNNYTNNQGQMQMGIFFEDNFSLLSDKETIIVTGQSLSSSTLKYHLVVLKTKKKMTTTPIKNKQLNPTMS